MSAELKKIRTVIIWFDQKSCVAQYLQEYPTMDAQGIE